MYTCTCIMHLNVLNTCTLYYVHVHIPSLRIPLVISNSMLSCWGENSKCSEPKNPSTSSLGPTTASFCFNLTLTVTCPLALATVMPWSSGSRRLLEDTLRDSSIRVSGGCEHKCVSECCVCMCVCVCV